jgi:hypothetical protein
MRVQSKYLQSSEDLIEARGSTSKGAVSCSWQVAIGPGQKFSFLCHIYSL